MSDFKLVKLLNPISINVNINPTGVYNNSTTYQVGDSVSYGNSSYICIQTSTGNVPTNTTYWQLLAAANTNKLTTTARNNTGSTIPALSVVYFSGASGNLPLLALSQANSEAASTKTIGITATAINNNASGEVIVFGLAENLNTSSLPAGVALWLSPTIPGGVTTVKPSAPNHMVFIGFVTRSHPTQGTIEIKVQNGFELEELHNVAISSPSTGQTITYDSSTSLWSNYTLTKSDVGLGNVDNTSDLNKPISTATQTALNAKEDLLGFTPEDVANKDTSTALGSSNTLYPSQAAVKGYVDTGLSGKEPTITAGTTAQYWRGDKSWQTLDKSAVGLNNVQNLDQTDPSNIVQDATHRFVSDTEKTTWNSKEPAITSGTVNDYWRGDKTFQNFNNAANAAVLPNFQRTNARFVHPLDGNDTSGTGSIAKPYQTIAKALLGSTANTTIYLFPGLYGEPAIALPDQVTIIGDSSGTTEITYGFTHTAASASNVSIYITGINYNSFNSNSSAAANGTVTFKGCVGSMSRTDNNTSVLFTNTESTILNSTLVGGSNIVSEALVLGTITIQSGLIAFENSRVISQIEASGNATVRTTDCQLFAAPVFVNGTIVSGNTPTWYVDLASDFSGGYSGAVNKVYLANIPGALGYTPATFINTVVSALIFG